MAFCLLAYDSASLTLSPSFYGFQLLCVCLLQWRLTIFCVNILACSIDLRYISTMHFFNTNVAKAHSRQGNFGSVNNCSTIVFNIDKII